MGDEVALYSGTKCYFFAGNRYIRGKPIRWRANNQGLPPHALVFGGDYLGLGVAGPLHSDVGAAHNLFGHSNGGRRLHRDARVARPSCEHRPRYCVRMQDWSKLRADKRASAAFVAYAPLALVVTWLVVGYVG